MFWHFLNIRVWSEFFPIPYKACSIYPSGLKKFLVLVLLGKIYLPGSGIRFGPTGKLGFCLRLIYILILFLVFHGQRAPSLQKPKFTAKEMFSLFRRDHRNDWFATIDRLILPALSCAVNKIVRDLHEQRYNKYKIVFRVRLHQRTFYESCRLFKSRCGS